MKDTTKVALGAAVAGGYILGRTKKGRLAIAVATYLTGRQAGLDPQQLVTSGLQKLKNAPQFAELGDQVRGELMDAGRQALAASADRSLAGLADSLHERTRKLEGREEAEEEEPEEDEPEEDEPEEDEPEEEEPEEEEPDEERGGAPAGKRARPSKDRAGDQAPAKKAPAKKAPAKKAPAKKAPAKKAPAKKTAGRKGSGRKSTSSGSDSRRR
ncbi:histone protein [Streptomyces sp. NPDC054802]